MSKFTRSLAVSSMAVGFAAFAGVGTVNAGAYDDYKNYWRPHGSYDSSDVHFKEHSDKSSSFYYALKEDKKKHDSEHFNYSSDSYRHDDKDKDRCRDYDKAKHDYGKHDDKYDKKYDYDKHGKYSGSWDHKDYDKKDKHDKYFDRKDCDKDKGYGGKYGNSVKVNYSADKHYSKSYEEVKAAKYKESYSADYHQRSKHADYGKGYGYGKKDHGKDYGKKDYGKKDYGKDYDKGYAKKDYGKDYGKGHGSYVDHSVSASVNVSKESSSYQAVKAEVASSSSVSANVDLKNYGPHGSYKNSVSAYENADYYSKVEAVSAEHDKQSSSVNYSADHSKADYGGKGKYGGVSLASSDVNYSAESSSESSKYVSYSAEESASYSSGFSASNSSYKKP